MAISGSSKWIFMDFSEVGLLRDPLTGQARQYCHSLYTRATGLCHPVAVTDAHHLPEDLLDPLQPGDQGVYVSPGRVDVHARSRRRRQMHPAHQRLRAMVPRPDADARLVENRRDVVRMYAVQREADHATAVFDAARSVLRQA